jgi:hypothetical protein
VKDVGATRTIRVRDKRKPGHCWQDNELYDVFQPVIGATATHIYAAMSRWAFGHRVEMGMREIAVESGTSRSAVQRALVAMERLGMVRGVAGRGPQPAAYNLLDLKEASIALGAEWNPHRASHGLSPTRVAELRTAVLHCVPYGDTKAGGNLPDCVPHGDASGTLLSQKRGVSVPHRDAHLYIYKQDTRLQDNHPLPLPPAEGGLRDESDSSDIAPAEGGLRDESDSSDIAPAEGGLRDESDSSDIAPAEGGLRDESESSDIALDREAQRVLRACGSTSDGVLRVIRKQLAERVRPATPEGLTKTAEWMIAMWEDYRTCGDRGWLRFVWGPRKFFGDGHWANCALWPIDEERREMYGRAREGAR